MILTYKIKHLKDFSQQLKQAKEVANFALANKSLSSASVKHFGLKSMISNQILKKYSKNRKLKRINSVKLTIPRQGIKFDKIKSELVIPCVDLYVKYYFKNDFIKINQVEIDKDYCYVSVSYQDASAINSDNFLGIDLNTISHCAVIANSKTGKVIKLGKTANHIHQKYKHIRKSLQKKVVKRIKNRESRLVKDLNHKISNKIVTEALKQNCHLKMEDLKGIRKGRKHVKSFRYALNSWSFYQLRQMIDYKAKKQGVIVTLIDPAYTSQTCSICGSLGERKQKTFKCPTCGHADHADSNASFNISKWVKCIGLLTTDRDVVKGSTDTPREAIL